MGLEAGWNCHISLLDAKKALDISASVAGTEDVENTLSCDPEGNEVSNHIRHIGK